MNVFGYVVCACTETNVTACTFYFGQFTETARWVMTTVFSVSNAYFAWFLFRGGQLINLRIHYSASHFPVAYGRSYPDFTSRRNVGVNCSTTKLGHIIIYIVAASRHAPTAHTASTQTNNQSCLSDARGFVEKTSQLWLWFKPLCSFCSNHVLVFRFRFSFSFLFSFPALLRILTTNTA